jgi:hypothetical protein
MIGAPLPLTDTLTHRKINIAPILEIVLLEEKNMF